MTPEDRRRDLARRRMVAYRDRRRRLVPVEVRPADLYALERLGLLEHGERDARAIGRACARFLAAAGAIAGIGEALWPDGDGESA